MSPTFFSRRARASGEIQLIQPLSKFVSSTPTIRQVRVLPVEFRTVTLAFLAGLFALTAVIWITQALRQFDLLTSKGQTVVVFITMTGLTIPSLVAIIAPVALFVGVLYCLNKLNGDSELIVIAIQTDS